MTQPNPLNTTDGGAGSPPDASTSTPLPRVGGAGSPPEPVQPAAPVEG